MKNNTKDKVNRNLYTQKRQRQDAKAVKHGMSEYVRRYVELVVKKENEK